MSKIENISAKQRLYWNQRHERMKQEIYESVDLEIDELQDVYEKALARLQVEIEKFYIKYSMENKISLLEARRQLNARELKEFKMTLEEYIKEAKRTGLSKEHIQQLKNASTRKRLDRQQVIYLKTQHLIEELAQTQQVNMQEYLSAVAETSYYRTAYTTQQEIGFSPFHSIHDNHIQNIVTERWVADNLGLSDRIWKDKTATISALKRVMLQGFITQKGYTAQSKELQRIMNSSFYNARRLLETEAAHVIESASYEAYKRLGVKKYEILAVLDLKTSLICQQMDAKVIPLTEWKTGITAPPFHPHCRTTTAPYIDGVKPLGRAYRDEDKTTQFTDESMNYFEWREKYVVDDL